MRALARNAIRAVRKMSAHRAVGNVAEVAAVYDDVYSNVDKYDSLDSGNLPKLGYVLDYAKGVQGQVLDAGCGRGSVLRHMLDNGIDAFGVELSAAACERYLGGLPVANTDIVAWADANHEYAGLVNTDVLEHIPPDQLDKTLDALKRLAPTAFLGIANHSSIHNGHELHVIQEGIGWWVRRVGQHYRKIKVIVPSREDLVLWANFNNESFFFLIAERD